MIRMRGAIQFCGFDEGTALVGFYKNLQIALLQCVIYFMSFPPPIVSPFTDRQSVS